MVEQPKTNPLAVASLALGIASFLFLGPIASVPGVILGHIARKQIRESSGTQIGDGFAIGGLVINYLNVLVIVLALIFVGSLITGALQFLT